MSSNQNAPSTKDDDSDWLMGISPKAILIGGILSLPCRPCYTTQIADSRHKKVPHCVMHCCSHSHCVLYRYYRELFCFVHFPTMTNDVENGHEHIVSTFGAGALEWTLAVPLLTSASVQPANVPNLSCRSS
jgi:hypothetical protein